MRCWRRLLCMRSELTKQLAKTIREKREQLRAIRAEVEDLIDYLEVLEARASDQNKARRLHFDVMKRYRIK